MKIFAYGDHSDTGFGIVMQNLLRRWRAAGHEITQLGINFYGSPYDHKKFDYDIWPCDRGPIEAVFGYAKFWQLVQQGNFDIVFMLNDAYVLERLWEFKPQGYAPTAKIVAYYPVDSGPMHEQWLDLLNTFDAQVCYTQFAEDVITAGNKGKRPKNLYQIPHGVDTKTFFPINTQIARQKLHLPLDAFIVGMVARNQYRKRFDIMCQGFAEFAKDKPEAKLYLHTAVKDVGFDIPNLIKQFNLEGKLIVTKDLTPAQGIPEKALNYVYNTFDVNCLISLGDGWGLPVAESMAVGCPQVVSGHSALKELVQDHGGLTVKTVARIMNTGGMNTWGEVSDYKDLADKLEILYKDKDLRIKYSEQAYNFITQEKYSWDSVSEEFLKIFNSVMHIMPKTARILPAA